MSNFKKKYCPVCGTSQQHILLLNGSKDYGSIYRCSKCNLARLLPLPSPIEHESNIYGRYKTLAESYNKKKAEWAKRSVKSYLSQLYSKGREFQTVLDLAGGLGYYSRAFANEGLEVTYVDMDPVSVSFAEKYNEKQKVKTIYSLIEDFCSKSSKTFDLIFFRHVIEHCIDPEKTLRLIQKVSHTNTILITETDNNLSIEHFLHPACGKYWRNVYQEHYNEKSLCKLIKIKPLAIDKIQTHYYAFRDENLNHLLKRTSWKVIKSYHYPLGDLIYWPNISRPIELSFWHSRSPKRLFYGIIYCILYPILLKQKMVAGLGAYSIPHINKK